MIPTYRMLFLLGKDKILNLIRIYTHIYLRYAYIRLGWQYRTPMFLF